MLLAADEICVWKILPAEFPAGDHSILDAGERERARAFRHENDRRQFLSARVARRRLAAQLLGDESASHDLKFSRNPFGKPEFKSSEHLHCNLSHTEGLTLLAFSRQGPLGIDLEKIDRRFNPRSEIAARFLSADDFFGAWVQREACGKVFGHGLGRQCQEEDFRIFPFVPAEGFVACAAVPKKAGVTRLRLQEFFFRNGSR